MHKKEEVKRRCPLLSSSKELLLALLIHQPELFERHKTNLLPEHFGEGDGGYRLVWQVVLDNYGKHGRLPGVKTLTREVAAAIAKAPKLLTEAERLGVTGVIDALSDIRRNQSPSPSPAAGVWAAKTIRKLREEVVANNLIENISGRNALIRDMPMILDTAQRAVENIQCVGAGKIDVEIFPKGWLKKEGRKLFPSGISFLDEFLAGGQAAGEVYGVMGPYGSCKTTLAVMLVVEAARQAYKLRLKGGPHQYAVLVTYEETLSDLQPRIMSYAARIRRDSFLSVNGKPPQLSSANDLKPYEKAMFREQLLAGVPVFGEQERHDQAIDWLCKHVIVVDMSGPAPSWSGAGGSFIPEIHRSINRELWERDDAKCRLVVIDYVGAAVDRHLIASNGDDKHVRHLIKRTPLQVRNEIAIRYGCPVWLFHQLSGKANAKSPGARLDCTDAAESKSFAENLDFCFVIGRPDGHGRCRFINAKHRRTDSRPEIIIWINGAISRVERADDYVLDTRARTIVEKDTVF